MAKQSAPQAPSTALIDLPFVELHTPLFLAGKNFGVKVEVSKHPGLTLQYAWEHQKLIVGWNGKAAFIPDSNIASATPSRVEDLSAALGVDIVVPKETYKKPLVVTAGPVPQHVNAPLIAQVGDPSRGIK